jgi:hypothetical protein
MGIPASQALLPAGEAEEMTIRPFQHFPGPAVINSLGDVASYLRTLRDALLQMRRGKLECVNEVTLTENVTTTAIVDPRLSIQSVVHFDPLTANAATELAAGTMYVLEANRTNGTWTITHANAASTNRSFRYSIIG